MEPCDNLTVKKNKMQSFSNEENFDFSKNLKTENDFKAKTRSNSQNENLSDENDSHSSNEKLCGGFGSGRRGISSRHHVSYNTRNIVNYLNDNNNKNSHQKNLFNDDSNNKINKQFFDSKNRNFGHFNYQNENNSFKQNFSSFKNQSKNDFITRKQDFSNKYYNGSSNNKNFGISNKENNFQTFKTKSFNNKKFNYQNDNFLQNNSIQLNTNNFQQNENDYNNPNFGFNKDTTDSTLKPLPNNYVPFVRELDEIYKEDIDHAENYRQIVDDDDEIAINGLNIGNQVVIDVWNDAGFHPILLKNIIERSKYVRPRKIQAHVIPLALQGRDIKGHAETGSGKTAAFMLPIIHMVMGTAEHKPLEKPSPYAIIIDPTRELCSQVYEQGLKLANETGVSVAKAYGQYNMRENLCELQAGCDILCATPGRLKHLVQSNLISLKKLKYFVLDEADTLLESNFFNEIRELITAPDFPDKEDRQTMLFSATFPELVQKLAMDVLKENCVMVSNQKLVATNSKICQRFLQVQQNNKKIALLEILENEMETAKKNDPNNPSFCRTLVFVKTKRDADLVSLFLTEKQIKATTINGDRSQHLREKALRDFRTNQVCVLVSTDVCARGIDIKDLDHVINMDLPCEAVTYVHRIGRTGRIKRGRATSFFDETNSNDVNIAPKLVEFLNDVQQPVPDFLIKAAEERGYYKYSNPDQSHLNDDEMFNW